MITIDTICNIIGSALGAIATIIAVWINKKVQYSGKISLHARIVYSKILPSHTWGYIQTDKGISLHIPCWLDICNTSGVSRIIRNVNICIVKNNNIISSFTQIQGNGTNPRDENTILLGDEGSYTFVVPANSAFRASLEFSLKESDVPKDDKRFDAIYLTYYDEKDKLHLLFFTSLNKYWEVGDLLRKEEWIALKETKKTKNVKLYERGRKNAQL